MKMWRLITTLPFIGGVALFFASAAMAFEIEEIKTPAGLTVWFVEEPSIPMISVEAIFPGGSVRDPAGLEGLAYFVSGLLDEGAGDLDADAFQTRMLERAIKLSFKANTDHFAVSMKTLSVNKAEAFELLGLALSKPRFDAEPVERVRSQILVSLKRAETSPSTILSNAWYEAMFPDHEYGRRRQGTIETVSAIKQADFRNFAGQQFTRDGLILGVVGDVDPDDLVTFLDETFGALPTSGGFIEPIDVPAFGLSRFQVIDHPIPQTRILFGNPGILRADPDFYAAYVLNYILGGSGLSSRLAKEVREKRGLAYGVGTSLAAYKQAGYLMGSTGTNNERVRETIEVIQAELEAVISGQLTEAELDTAKAYLTGSYPLNFDSNSKIANALVQLQYDDLGIDYIERRNGIIEAITLDEIKAVAERFIKPDEMIWMLVGQPVGVDEMITKEGE